MPTMLSTNMLMILIVITIAVILTQLFKQFPSTKNAYVPAPTLFTRAELSFFGVLQKSVGERYAIFGKVRCADVINVKSGLPKKRWQLAFNQICAKHFDYVLCERRSSQIVAVIELNDKSHQRRDRRKRDEMLQKICAEINLPLLMFNASHGYSVVEVRETILAAANRKANN